ncbi:MAG TPA: mandelate racemase/muconate lactonizing enzyme family protein [Blastocatellia bacterium]|nr:mandelate racemase/muconate lactonizing enzyme family protein [Blastocatellia bacterium]
MRRRDFLGCAIAGSAGALLAPMTDTIGQTRAQFRNLKITAVDTFVLTTGSIFVLVRTSDGITGLGECSPMNAKVILAMLRDALIPIVIGKNPLDIERLWDEMYHRTFKLGVMGAQPEAMSGIDIALWDILGKVTGLPLWQLLGGKRKDRIRLYSSIGGGSQAKVQEQVAKAIESVHNGFTALKMRMDWSSRSVDVDPKKDWEIVSTTRKEVGDKIDLGYDANNGLSVSTAIRLGRRFQDELNVIHYEEPIAQTDYAGYVEVCAALDMPVAAGEHEYTRWQFRDLIERAKVDILQPDLVKCCGLSEAIRIANLAQTYNKILVPHQTQPTIGTMVNVHFLACFDNSSRAQEYNYSPKNSEQLWRLFKQDFSPKSGYITVPEGPGLGLELDEAALKGMVA